MEDISKMTDIKINLEFELYQARKACRVAVKHSWEMVKCGILTLDDPASWQDINEKSDVADSIKAKLIKAFPDWVDYEQMRWDAVDTDSESDSDNDSSLDEKESDDELRYNGDDLS